MHMWEFGICQTWYLKPVGLEENKYILMHICGIQKNDVYDLTCKAEIDMDIEKKMYGYQEGKVRGWWENQEVDLYISPYIHC